MGDAQNSKQQRGRPFQKGDARINRGGRPKGYNAFRKSFRKMDDLDLIRARLIKEIGSGTGKDAINAAKLWMEYGFGKAPAAPEDNDALRDSGGARLSDSLSREDIVRISRGEPLE